jgi:signal transduction histidine kinase
LTPDEFTALRRAIDIVIAEAATEYSRLAAEAKDAEEVERLGSVAHELRDMLNVALFAYEALRDGQSRMDGNIGQVLGRSLTGLRHFVETTLTDVRIRANQQRRVRICVASLVNEIAAAAKLHADFRQVQFTIEPLDPTLAVDADPQLLSSALMNLLSNAFKYTPAGAAVVLSVHADDGRLRIDVRDGCGGIRPTNGDPFRPFGDRRGSDRSGLGHGLAIAPKASGRTAATSASRTCPAPDAFFRSTCRCRRCNRSYRCPPRRRSAPGGFATAAAGQRSLVPSCSLRATSASSRRLVVPVLSNTLVR